jgi:hypothetical protein
MRNILKWLAVAGIVASASGASAKPGSGEHYKVPFNAADGTTFATEDMSGPAQTAVIEVGGFTWVTFYISAASVSGTANVTINCNTGGVSSDVNYPVQSESVSSGVATFYDYVPTKSVTTSDKWPVTIGVLGKSYLQCTFTCASGTVNATAWAR